MVTVFSSFQSLIDYFDAKNFCGVLLGSHIPSTQVQHSVSDKIAVEPVNPSELPKMLDGLRK